MVMFHRITNDKRCTSYGNPTLPCAWQPEIPHTALSSNSTTLAGWATYEMARWHDPAYFCEKGSHHRQSQTLRNMTVQFKVPAGLCPGRTATRVLCFLVSIDSWPHYTLLARDEACRRMPDNSIQGKLAPCPKLVRERGVCIPNLARIPELAGETPRNFTTQRGPGASKLIEPAARRLISTYHRFHLCLAKRTSATCNAEPLMRPWSTKQSPLSGKHQGNTRKRGPAACGNNSSAEVFSLLPDPVPSYSGSTAACLLLCLTDDMSSPNPIT